MTVEVLLSVMNQTDLSIVDKCNIHSNCIIINQCDKEEQISVDREFGRIKMISTKERGLSRSRNMALENSTADICVLCDDDIVYVNGYEKIIKNAFQDLPHADLIVFNIRSMNTDIRPQEEFFCKAKKVPKHKMYSSVHIAFRRKKIKAANLKFDIRFGAGSGIYSMAEDSIFFSDAHKAGLSAYVYPAIIADLYSDKSSWFHGYDEKYFYDIGAFLQVSFPYFKYLYCFYYPFRLYKQMELKPCSCLEWIWNGIYGCKLGMSYSDYLDWRNKKNISN